MHNKMTLADKIKTLDDKVKTIQAQYNLDREADKISALSLGKFDKYEYLAGDDLTPKSESIEEATFEYSQLSKSFNRGSQETDNKINF